MVSPRTLSSSVVWILEDWDLKNFFSVVVVVVMTVCIVVVDRKSYDKHVSSFQTIQGNIPTTRTRSAETLTLVMFCLRFTGM